MSTKDPQETLPAARAVLGKGANSSGNRTEEMNPKVDHGRVEL